jgi:hypothetical protein
MNYRLIVWSSALTTFKIFFVAALLVASYGRVYLLQCLHGYAVPESVTLQLDLTPAGDPDVWWPQLRFPDGNYVLAFSFHC